MFYIKYKTLPSRLVYTFMFLKLYLGPTRAALNRPHGVAHCSQHVWPAVPFQNVIYLKIQFSLHKVYELYHFVFSFCKASTTRLMHYNDIPRYPIFLQASKIAPWPLVSASRELGVIPGSLDSRAGHPPVWRANSRSRTTRVACAIKCHFFRFSFSSSHIS